MRRSLLIAASLLLCFPAAASADPEDEANRISTEVMSPYCPGVTLHDCPTEAAVRLRERIVEWSEAGWSRDRILDRLEAEYGASIRSTPPTSGIGLWAWIAPALVVVVGLAVAVSVARRWSGRAAIEGSPRASTEIERARLEAELAHAREEL